MTCFKCFNAFPSLFFWLIVTPWPVGSLSDWLQSLSNPILIFSEDVQGSSCVFPTPDLGPAISLRSLGSFHWKMVFVSIWGIGAFQWCCPFPFGGVSMFLLCFHHPRLYFSLACCVDSFVKCRVGYDYPALCKCGQRPGASALLIPKKPTGKSPESDPRLVWCKSQ